MVSRTQDSLSRTLGMNVLSILITVYMPLLDLVITEGENQCNSKQPLYIQGVSKAKHWFALVTETRCDAMWGMAKWWRARITLRWQVLIWIQLKTGIKPPNREVIYFLSGQLDLKIGLYCWVILLIMFSHKKGLFLLHSKLKKHWIKAHLKHKTTSH